MWVYEKKLEYPVKVSCPDPRMAKNIITQYGGPDGEASASMQYLTQRFAMPINEAKGILSKSIYFLHFLIKNIVK